MAKYRYMLTYQGEHNSDASAKYALGLIIAYIKLPGPSVEIEEVEIIRLTEDEEDGVTILQE